MTIAKHYEAFAALQKEYPRTWSNDFLVPADIRHLIKYGKLSYIADDAALFAFIQREGSSKLIFRLRSLQAKLPAMEDVPLTAYLVYREGNLPSDTEAWLFSQGFTHASRLDRYTGKDLPCEGADDGISEASLEETYAMLQGQFSTEEVDLPCRDMFEGGALSLRAEDGSLLGVIYDMGHTRITTVSPAARGQGVGARLYRAYAARAIKDKDQQTFYEWIRPSNVASIAMVTKLGFTRDTLLMDCYTRR